MERYIELQLLRFSEKLLLDFFYSKNPILLEDKFSFLSFEGYKKTHTKLSSFSYILSFSTPPVFQKLH